jgi:hydroxyacylglutathione hydrolase
MPVLPIACRVDNYAYLLTCRETQQAVVIDPSEAGPVLHATANEIANVAAILCTHHHYDHVEGNVEVMHALGVERLYGHASDRGRIPGQTHLLQDGDTLEIGKLKISTLYIPAHTMGSVAYVVTGEDDPIVFTGDTLFVASCGRLFEGTPTMLCDALQKLIKLDGRMRIYCGHEYTALNLEFAAHVEPTNQAITEAQAKTTALRSKGKPTIPSTIENELRINPFLRSHLPTVRSTLGIPATASPGDAIGALRKIRGSFG